MKKVGLLLIFAFGVSLVCSNFAVVSAISVSATSTADTIIPDYNQPAKIHLTFNDIPTGTYNIYTLTNVRILPSNPLTLSSGSSTDIYVYANDNMEERGTYNFNYNIGSYEEMLKVRIIDLEDSIEISSDAISLDSNNVTFYIRNLEKSELTGIKARFSSVLFDVNEKFDLTPYGKTIFTIPVDNAQLRRLRAGPYTIKAEFETDKGVKTIEGKIYIGEKKGIKTEEDYSGFLIRTDTVTKINVGNTFEDVSVNVSKNIVSRLFTGFNVDPSTVNRHGFMVDYSWTQSLGPADVFIVKTTTNYVYPLLIVIIAGLAIWGFRRISQRKIEVRKSVSHVRTNGGEFALRVYLHVKARDRVDNVSLIDRIPQLVKVHKQFGSVKPDKIDADNRRLQWYLGNLNPGEVRSFSYVIYSKLGIVGKFALPSAVAMFEKDGEIKESESNKVFFLNEQIRREKD